jgi:hypothetical protein
LASVADVVDAARPEGPYRKVAVVLIGFVAVIAAIDATLQFRMAAIEEKLNLNADVQNATASGQSQVNSAYLSLKEAILADLDNLVNEHSVLVIRNDMSSQVMALADYRAYRVERPFLMDEWKSIPLDGGLTPEIRAGLLVKLGDLPDKGREIDSIRNQAAEYGSRQGRAALGLFVAAAAGALFALVGISRSGRGVLILVAGALLLFTSVALSFSSFVGL